MSLSKLKLVSARKATTLNPVQSRRNKLTRRIAEQIDMATAASSGSKYQAVRTKSVMDPVSGELREVSVSKRMKPWWFVSDNGKLCLQVRYGAKVLELAKGKNAIEVASMDELVGTLTAVKEAVLAGEMDALVDAASRDLRKGFSGQ
jgi:hypothetical protein